MNGDLLVKVVVKDTIKNLKRVNEDLHFTLDISLIDAIFGCKKEIETIENTIESINVSSGVQSNDKIVIDNRVKLIKIFRDFILQKIIVKIGET